MQGVRGGGGEGHMLKVPDGDYGEREGADSLRLGLTELEGMA